MYLTCTRHDVEREIRVLDRSYRTSVFSSRKALANFVKKAGILAKSPSQINLDNMNFRLYELILVSHVILQKFLSKLFYK